MEGGESQIIHRLNSLFSRDVMYISKCKIAELLSFQLSLVIEILNTFRFEGFQFNSNLRFYSRAF